MQNPLKSTTPLAGALFWLTPASILPSRLRDEQMHIWTVLLCLTLCLANNIEFINKIYIKMLDIT